jgi:hypothetical protein
VLAQRLADRDKIAKANASLLKLALTAMEQRLSEARGESGYRGERLQHHRSGDRSGDGLRRRICRSTWQRRLLLGRDIAGDHISRSR